MGADSSVRTARTTTSSRLTPKSPKYRIEPSTPIVSGSFPALSVYIPSQHQVPCRSKVPRLPLYLSNNLFNDDVVPDPFDVLLELWKNLSESSWLA